jgi:hypothetical protein
MLKVPPYRKEMILFEFWRGEGGEMGFKEAFCTQHKHGQKFKH